LQPRDVFPRHLLRDFHQDVELLLRVCRIALL